VSRRTLPHTLAIGLAALVPAVLAATARADSPWSTPASLDAPGGFSPTLMTDPRDAHWRHG
jgi:hypothetical protein